MAKKTPKLDPKRVLSTSAMQRAVTRIVETAALSTAEIMTRDIEIRRAIAAGFGPAIESLPVVVREPVFMALLMTSTAAQRKLIAQHPCCEPGWVEAAEIEVVRLAEEARKEREAKAAARVGQADDAPTSDA